MKHNKNKNKKKPIKNNSKNYSEKVKVGEFKTPGEIIRDLINSGAVQSLRSGGYLNNGGKTKPYSGKGDATERSYSGMQTGLDKNISSLGSTIINTFNDIINPTNSGIDWDKKLAQSEKKYRDAKTNQFLAESRLMRNFPNAPMSKDIQQKYEPVLESPVDSNQGYTVNPPIRRGGGALGVANTLAPLANLVAPGVGAALQGITGLVQSTQEREEVDNIYTMNQQLKDGGEVSGFKQYNAPTHEQGGQMVNKDGTPDNNNPVAEIEGSENAYNYNVLPDKAGSNYVFSDVNQTSGMVRDIISKYKTKNADKDLATKAAMEMEIKGVENINETLNAAKAAVTDMMQMKYGGKTKYENGGPGFQPLDFTEMYGGTKIPLRDVTVSPLETRMPTSVESMTPTDYNIPEIQSNNKSNLNLDLSALGDGIKNNMPNILRTAGIVGSGIDAFQKPEEDELIMPDFSQSDQRMNDMNATLDQARQDVTGASNRGSELNRGASSSYSQFRARELSNIANLQDQLGRIGMQEQGMRNQILGQQGQYEMNKAMTERNIKQEQQIANLQNQARTQDLRRQFMSDIVHEADRQSMSQNVENISNAKYAEGIKILEMIAPDMNVSKEMVQNFVKVSRGKMKPEDLSDEELVVFTRLNGK